ncbi:MAG: hypothetical protein ACRCS9_01440, partial [Hyphomicrobium sp.]
MRNKVGFHWSIVLGAVMALAASLLLPGAAALAQSHDKGGAVDARTLAASNHHQSLIRVDD